MRSLPHHVPPPPPRIHCRWIGYTGNCPSFLFFIEEDIITFLSCLRGYSMAGSQFITFRNPQLRMNVLINLQFDIPAVFAVCPLQS